MGDFIDVLMQSFARYLEDPSKGFVKIEITDLETYFQYKKYMEHISEKYLATVIDSKVDLPNIEILEYEDNFDIITQYGIVYIVCTNIEK